MSVLRRLLLSANADWKYRRTKSEMSRAPFNIQIRMSLSIQIYMVEIREGINGGKLGFALIPSFLPLLRGNTLSQAMC